MNYRSYIAETIKNGGMIKTSRTGLVPANYKSLNNSIKHMKIGSGTPAHKKINDLEFLSLKKKTNGSGLKYKPLTMKFN